MKKIFNLLFLLLTLCSREFFASDVQDKLTGQTFPREITFTHNNTAYKLSITGVATKRNGSTSLYSVASYLQNEAVKQDLLTEMLQGDYAKQLTIKWISPFLLKQLQDSYFQEFQQVLTPFAFSAIQNDINSFVLLFNENVRVGDTHVLRSLPQGQIQVFVNDRLVGQIQSLKFANALWKIWFGENSVVSRADLLILK